MYKKRSASKLIAKFAIASVVMMGAAVGVTPAKIQAGGLPVEKPKCDAKIDHSIRLGHNMTCVGSVGLRVETKGVTIDLNGHTISGSGTHQGVLLTASDTVLRNGTVRRFEHGVYVSGVRARVERVAAVDNTLTGFEVHGANVMLAKNVASANGQSGFHLAFAQGISAVANVAVNNKGSGIFVNSPGSRIERNVTSGNTGAGISLQIADGSEVVENRVIGNGTTITKPGIELLSVVDGALVKGNLIIGNSEHGYRDEGSNNRVIGNVVEGNGFHLGDDNDHGGGIDVASAKDPVGQDNVARGNDGPGCTTPSFCKPAKVDKKLPVKNPPCGALITSSLRLGKDMNCPSHGLIVGAPNVTIDLGGFTLRGNELGQGIANDDQMPASGFGGVTVRNGVVRGFVDGVNMSCCKDNSVLNVVAADNANVGIILAGPGAALKKSTSVANHKGVDVEGKKAVIVANRIANNSEGLILAGAHAKVEKNTLSGNRMHGALVPGDDNTFTANTFSGNGTQQNVDVPGLRLEGSGNTSAKGRFHGNGGNGYEDAGSSNKVTASKAHGNGYKKGDQDTTGAGLDASYAAAPKGSGNQAVGNDGSIQCLPLKFC